MTQTELDRQVFEIIADHFSVPVESISRQTTASDVRGWDSVEHVALLMNLEDQLGIEFDIERVGTLSDVGEFIDECARLLGR